MNNINIEPRELSGIVNIPPSKSISHRAIICAGLSDGKSRIDNIILSDDMYATINGLRNLGVQIDINESVDTDRCSLDIQGSGRLEIVNNEIDCNESGSTIRFLIPMGCLVDGEVIFAGSGKLVERPLKTYYQIFEEQGIEYETRDGKLPLKVNGRLKPGIFKVPGNISSQFITGLMFVLPLLDGDSQIVITSELESKGYVDLTIDMLNKFSVDVENDDYKSFRVKGNQKYMPCNYSVEGDFSQVAFFVVGGLLGNDIKCKGMNFNSKQGDIAIIDIVKRMGGDIELKGDCIHIKKSNTVGAIIDGSQCPDIIPVLAVLASLSKGETQIINAGRLRIKESDRLESTRTELNKLGANVEETEDGLIIKGVDHLDGGNVDSWNDHRIAMSMAIASIKAKEEVTLSDALAVTKSYPGFWDDFKSLGGKIDE